MRKPSDLVIGGKGMIAEREDVIVRSSREKGFSQVNRWKQEREYRCLWALQYSPAGLECEIKE